MGIVINELSLQSFSDIHAAQKAICDLISVFVTLDSKYDIRISDIYGGPVYSSYQIVKGVPFIQFINNVLTKDQRMVILSAMQKTKKFSCEGIMLRYKGREAVGATYAFENDGVTLSLLSEADFGEEVIEYTKEGKNVIVRNAFCEKDIIKHAEYITVRIFEPNPKHGGKEYIRSNGELVSAMDLDNDLAQRVLNKAVCVNGEVFGVHDGEIYEFRRTLNHIFHGFKRRNIDDYEKNIILQEFQKRYHTGNECD